MTRARRRRLLVRVLVRSLASAAILVWLYYVLPLQDLQGVHLAVSLSVAVAILVDATVVRSLLLPSLMKLLGEWNWWMPRFLRWVPRITIEGEPEEVLGGSDL